MSSEQATDETQIDFFRHRVDALEQALDAFMEEAENRRRVCGSYGHLRLPMEKAQAARQQFESPTTQYCPTCQRETLHTESDSCVVCIGLFSDV